MIKILRITTVQESLESLLKGQMLFFKKQGFDIAMASAITSPDRIKALENQEDCKHYDLPLTRKITPLKDLRAIWETYLLIRQFKPDIVHTHTPKAGMVGMISAWLARVPIRLHTVAGLPLMERTGFVKKVLIEIEKLTYFFSTKVYPNSFGLKEYINTYISNTSKIKVIGEGSSNGINITNFTSSLDIIEVAQKIRRDLQLSDIDYVWVFVGRVVRDKGINELIEAFSQFQQEYKNNSLLIVGPYEKELDPVKEQTEKLLKTHPKIFHVGFQKDIRPYLCLSKTLVFPSYREGFPNVPMQSACMGLSLILSDINGCNELIRDNESGVLIPPKSVDGIVNAMKKLYLSEDLANLLAENAKKEIKEKYSQPIVWNHILNEYNELLNQKIFSK
jgi:glycosyltransferase involved in cell wall biosynthesis